MKPVLYIVIPCYNEEAVLPITAPTFKEKIESLASRGLISGESRVLFVNDGSKDKTWDIICDLSKSDPIFKGISLSRNKGHQNALLAGLNEAAELCDISISIDCDGQDDINAMDKMVEEYLDGADVVYGVRANRETDTFFKRTTAQGFYKFMKLLGADVVYNHADYRLMSAKVLKELKNFKEVNLFLRGIVPLVGFKSTCVYYERKARLAGKGHYPLKRMISLALNGITSLSIRPIRIITALGFIVAVISLVGIIWSVAVTLMGKSVAGWASIVSITCFLGGIQLLSLGVIGEYIGKMYLEVKGRPRYIIEKRTEEEV
ncbi:MAG: glycosyltransferase family 2 protein [Acutalibacteraceae bacterium]|nr:glycosyltransferase family 2 protein [Acutalibacteraceae bacterium]